jgi:hypothetical protein
MVGVDPARDDDDAQRVQERCNEPQSVMRRRTINRRHSRARALCVDCFDSQNESDDVVCATAEGLESSSCRCGAPNEGWGSAVIIHSPRQQRPRRSADLSSSLTLISNGSRTRWSRWSKWSRIHHHDFVSTDGVSAHWTIARQCSWNELVYPLLILVLCPPNGPIVSVSSLPSCTATRWAKRGSRRTTNG